MLVMLSYQKHQYILVWGDLYLIGTPSHLKGELTRRRGSLAKEGKRGRKRKNIIKEQINTKTLWDTLVSILVTSVADKVSVACMCDF